MKRTRFALPRPALLLLSLAMMAAGAPAATEQILHAFNAFGHGGNPQASLIADAAGNLYGTASTGGIVNGGVVFKLTPTASGRWKETILHEFTGGSDGLQPMSGLAFDKAGNLYGTTYYGGSGSSYGIVFELSPHADGSWNEEKIHVFQQSPDGANPLGNLVIDANDNLYGTTSGGGVNSYYGTVFELSPTGHGGWKETILYSFTDGTDGASPAAGVILDSSGNLYGTTTTTVQSYGTVFQLTPSSTGQWTESTLYRFSGSYDGGTPYAGLVFDGAGNLYGSTEFGGIYAGGGFSGYGVVFELTPSSNGDWTEKVLWSPTYVSNPLSGLVFDVHGNLYGTASSSAYGNCYNGCGSVFELSPSGDGGWTASVIYDFFGNLDGQFPAAGLILDAAGNLYGTTATGAGANCTWINPNSPGGPTGCGTVFKLTPSSSSKWIETQLYAFPGTDGAWPSTLTSDGNGNLYGTTLFGGAYGWGDVFELTPSHGKWTTNTLYSFTGASDGGNPNGIIFDREGNLYGSTEVAGASASQGTGGCGTVFRLTHSAGGTWKNTTLFRFPQTNYPIITGCLPMGNLVFDNAGNLYGTTELGGPTCAFNGLGGCGLIFELSPAATGPWTETVLHDFASSTADGIWPNGGMVFDNAGNLYGTTWGGGNCSLGLFGCGTVFELSPGSGGIWNENVIYNFTTSSGYFPNPGLIFDAAGNLYGTTESGGQTSHNPYGCGTVFQLSPSAGTWNTTTLYAFAGTSDGCSPPGGVILGANGNLYGTTYSAGSALNVSCGTAYELSPSSGTWTLHVLHSFAAGSDGCGPNGSLVPDSAGKLYGVAQNGGVDLEYYYGLGMGVVFQITP